MSKYDELSEIIDRDDAESFQKYLDQGLTIGNEWEDKVAFEEALGVQESAEVFPYVRDKSKPLDAYEFKVAELFLRNGFDLRYHRSLLTERVYSEISSWWDSDGYSSYGQYPDGRGSVFLIKHGAPVLWLLANPGVKKIGTGETALDIAYQWSKPNIKHELIIPYLEKAGCKRASDLSYQERLIASNMWDVVNLDELESLDYFLNTIEVFNNDELDGGGESIILKIAEKYSLSIDDASSSLEWEKRLDILITKGLSIQKTGKGYNWFWVFVQGISKVKLHPSHLQNDTDLKFMDRLLSCGVNINQIRPEEHESVLDLAINQCNQRLVDYLRRHGAKTLEELKAEGQAIPYGGGWRIKPHE